VRSSAQFLSPAEAAKRLGVSAKALRLYERRGLIAPGRTAAGWRVYGTDAMARAAEIVALRALGLSLAEVARALEGDPRGLEPALAAHQASLRGRINQLTGAIEKVRDLTRLLEPAPNCSVAFDLPWPWGGERFELRDVRPLNYIIGPLGSGKTRLARRIAETLPNAAFLGLDRATDGATVAMARLDTEPTLRARVEESLAWLVDEGATASPSLIALLVGLVSEGPVALVVDMVEQGLDHATQEAVIAHLRLRATAARPLFLMTRSSAILDLSTVGRDEAIILCPANHSPPTQVAPYPGAPGYEAVATCLASPEVRARTDGTFAWRPKVEA
jgi:DNA-binding transcriptional MerR regulator